jgi:hypothetical protein
MNFYLKQFPNCIKQNTNIRVERTGATRSVFFRLIN